MHTMKPEPDGGSPTCRKCGVEAFVRQGRYVCRIAWKNQHGQGAKRRLHRLDAEYGLVTCACGEKVTFLEEIDNYICTTQVAQALRGVERMRRIYGEDNIEDARELGNTPVKTKELTDADAFGVDPEPRRAYVSFRGRVRR